MEFVRSLDQRGYTAVVKQRGVRIGGEKSMKIGWGGGAEVAVRGISVLCQSRGSETRYAFGPRSLSTHSDYFATPRPPPPPARRCDFFLTPCRLASCSDPAVFRP